MKILYSLLYGSKSWKSRYAKDNDCIVIVDKLENGKDIEFHKDKINDIDIFYQTADYTKKVMKFEIENQNNRDYKELPNLYKEQNNPDFPIKVDWLGVEKKYKIKLKDIILNDLDKNDKYLYTYYILFKMWETKDNTFKDEYTQVVNDFKFKQNIDVMKEYIKKELGVIHNG